MIIFKDSKIFKNPVYKDFAPVIDSLLDNPQFLDQSAVTDPANLIQTEEDKREWMRNKDIALEKIEAILIKAFPGTAQDKKKQKLEALEMVFGTTSWTEISKNISLEILCPLWRTCSILVTSLTFSLDSMTMHGASVILEPFPIQKGKEITQ